MLLGVDFDNTIVCYDAVIHQVAVERGLIPPEVPAIKGAVRDHLRAAGREEAWTELQGYVYGRRMQEASPFPGALELFCRCRQQGVATCIISHKTLHPFQGPPYDLHAAAHRWLESHGFFDPGRGGLQPRQVHFELTREGKLERIAREGCSHFVDDLPEFLGEPGFPAGVERILFDPHASHRPDRRFALATSWAEVARIVLGPGRPL